MTNIFKLNAPKKQFMNMNSTFMFSCNLLDKETFSNRKQEIINEQTIGAEMMKKRKGFQL